MAELVTAYAPGQSGHLSDHAKIAKRLTYEIDVYSDYDAPTNGTTAADSEFAAAWAAAAGKRLVIPKRGTSYRLTSALPSTAPPKEIVSDGATIFVDIPNASGNTSIFNIAGNGVTVEGLTFDGTGKTGTPAGNRYCIQALGSSGTHLNDIFVRDCRFTNMDTGFFAGTKPATTLVMHGVYLSWVDNCEVEDCYFEQLSGSAVFYVNNTHCHVRDNRVNDCLWYPVHLDGNNKYFEIAGNSINGTDTHSSYWGGLIDLMSQVGVGSNTHGRVHHNYLSGTVTYGSVGAIRCASSRYVEIDNNTFDGIVNNSVIRVQMRQVVASTNGGAPVGINIHDNVANAGQADQNFIYADNGTTAGGTGSIELARGLKVHDNILDSTSSSLYFACLAQVHGQDGGYTDIQIQNNMAAGDPGTGGELLGGMVTLVANSGQTVENFNITGNTLRFYNGSTNVGANAADAAINIDAYARRGHVADNVLHSWYYGIKTGTNAGPAISGVWDGNNRFYNSQSRDVNWANSVVGETVTTTASASTVTLGNAGDVHVINGTTTINTVAAAGNEGRRVTLVFQGALTVSDGGGNLALEGNFVTTANDTLTLVCDGTTWFEVARSAN